MKLHIMRAPMIASEQIEDLFALAKRIHMSGVLDAPMSCTKNPHNDT